MTQRGRPTCDRLNPGQRRRVTEAAMIGAIVARGLLSDTVIVSDEAGQFDVFQHALCWLHAERHLRQIVCMTDQQHQLVAVQRQLVWWFYADLKFYKEEPSSERRTALQAALRPDLRPGHRLCRPR